MPGEEENALNEALLMFGRTKARLSRLAGYMPGYVEVIKGMCDDDQVIYLFVRTKGKRLMPVFSREYTDKEGNGNDINSFDIGEHLPEKIDGLMSDLCDTYNMFPRNDLAEIAILAETNENFRGKYIVIGERPFEPYDLRCSVSINNSKVNSLDNVMEQHGFERPFHRDLYKAR